MKTKESKRKKMRFLLVIPKKVVFGKTKPAIRLIFDDEKHNIDRVVGKLRAHKKSKPRRFLCKALIYSVTPEGFKPPTF